MDRRQAGELGSLPIIFGLIVIAIVFQTQNDRFLTAGNFVNLMVQSAPYAVLAMGVVFVLLLGEIDLSSASCPASAACWWRCCSHPTATRWRLVAIALALLAGLAIGTLHGLFFAKIGIRRSW